MLELSLTLQDQMVRVHVNGVESHKFYRIDLTRSTEERIEFFNNPRPYGETLFNAIFQKAARTEYETLLKQTERTIVLVLESPELDRIAWEYIYNNSREEYVVEECTFVRALPENERPANGRLRTSYTRIPLLFIPANPLVNRTGEPMEPLDEESEWEEISQNIRDSDAGFDLYKMLPATPKRLQTLMAKFHDGLIVHFSGHGAVEDGKATLLFEEENGASRSIDARDFMRDIKDKSVITFLSSCQSAVAESTEFSNLARGLVKAGVPFALGMQFNLPDRYSVDISGQFYNYLTHGHTVLEAARQARRAVKHEHEFYVGMIALYTAHPDEIGQLIWQDTGTKTIDLFRPVDLDDRILHTSMLIGRQHDLMHIGTKILDRRKPLTLTLHGPSGIGKTALLVQALKRFSPYFDLTFAFTLDPLPTSLENVLGRIERFLGLPSPCKLDTKERELFLRNMLVDKRTLLGLDNFETLNNAVDEEDTENAKTARSLHAFFNSLAANGVTLLITSTDVTNLDGETREEISGLSNAGGGKLFWEKVVKRKDAIEPSQAEQISDMVGGLPLALCLLASAFDNESGLSLDQYIDNLQIFLPKAHNKWTKEMRHRSLSASFGFSMNSLSKSADGKMLQAALAKLSVFIGFFVDFNAAIIFENRFPEDMEDAEKMRFKARDILDKLWRRSLLERLVAHLDDGDSFLYRLHPALNRLSAEYATTEDLLIVEERYVRLMKRFADGAYPGNKGGFYNNPFLVTLLRYAMADLLKASNIRKDETTPALIFQTAFFQKHFGELDGAMELYHQALDGFKEIGDLKGEASTLHAMADIYETRGDLDGAMKLYLDSLEIDNVLGDRKNKASALYAIAGIHRNRGDLSGALELYQQTWDIREEIGDLRGKSSTLYSMARTYQESGDLDKAENLYLESSTIAGQLGDRQGMSENLSALGTICAARGDLDLAMEWFQSSMRLREKTGDLKGKASCLHNIASILQKRGDWDEAMRLYAEAFEIFDKLGDWHSKSAVIHQIADIYVRRGGLDQAKKLYQESLEIREGLGDLRGKSTTLRGIASIEKVKGNLDEALVIYEQTMDIANQLDDSDGKSSSLHGIADIYLRRGQLGEAMKLYQQSLALNEKLGNRHGKALTLGMMGQALWTSQQYGQAIVSLWSGLSLLQALNIDPESQKGMMSTLVNCRNDLGSEKFDDIWQTEVGELPPTWLTQPSEEKEEGITIDQFVTMAIQAAREKRPIAEKWFKGFQKMANDPDSPEEPRELGRVVTRIMAGETNVDFSNLPEYLREAIKKGLQ